jgi:SAM-dependent methyltransferase
MDSGAIRAKFGQDYAADERTFVMGIDLRFTTRIAERFRNRRALETCTGGGFTTIALARAAAHVTSVEIDSTHQSQARQNLARASLLERVTFVLADITDERTWEGLPRVDAAFLDPDWAVTGPGHTHRFLRSTTRPPADALLERTFCATRNVALVLPPGLDVQELSGLPGHERQKLFMGQSHELYCLYFGDRAVSLGETELRCR